MWKELEELKQQFSLLDYLRRHNWSFRRVGQQQEFVGLCPLHQETRPSFYVNAAKNVFYCHGCRQGGDLIRFAQLYFALPFRQTVAQLKQELGRGRPIRWTFLPFHLDPFWNNTSPGWQALGCCVKRGE